MTLICNKNTRVYFHGLPELSSAESSLESSLESFLQAAVFLVKRLYEQDSSKKIAILCEPKNSAPDLDLLDQWLWSLSPESFLPHSFEAYPIYLSSELPETSPDILIHLNQRSLFDSQFNPEFNSQLDSETQEIPEIHEIVGKSPEYREYCRTLFREYKKNGIKISYHEVQDIYLI